MFINEKSLFFSFSNLNSHKLHPPMWRPFMQKTISLQQKLMPMRPSKKKLLPHGLYLNRKCRCVRKRSCGVKRCRSGYKFNRKNCECRSNQISCRKLCPPGTELDAETCECLSNQASCFLLCPPGERLESPCQCVPVVEPPLLVPDRN